MRFEAGKRLNGCSPKVLITGRGTSGSWAIRGLQLGKAMGATVKANARDFDDHDVIIGVKRVDVETLNAIRTSGLPWVWDCVDAFPQPACGTWTRDQSIKWARDKIKELKPNAVVWPNKRMMEDVGFDGQQIVLYHHGRPGSRIGVIREYVREVGYEGSERYLGEYTNWLPKECEKRGWRFHINPPVLGDMDIVVAIRDGAYNGYPQQQYKSNVKLANAQISGRPFVSAPEAGYVETASGAELFVSGKVALMAAMDSIKDYQTRVEISERMLAGAPRLEDIAGQYREWLEVSKF